MVIPLSVVGLVPSPTSWLRQPRLQNHYEVNTLLKLNDFVQVLLSRHLASESDPSDELVQPVPEKSNEK